MVGGLYGRQFGYFVKFDVIAVLMGGDRPIGGHFKGYFDDCGK
jgi:hypothetical protein